MPGRRIPSGRAVLSGSADVVSDAFALIGAPDRRKSRHRVEQLRYARACAWRLGQWAGPTRQHDQIEIGRAQLRVEEQRATGLEMIFDDVEESAGPRFRATLHDLR